MIKTKKSKSKKNKLKPVFRFGRFSTTKKLAFIFVILFALVGSYLLIKSFALSLGIADTIQYERANSTRTDKGITSLGVSQCLTDRATAWAQHMAATNSLVHNDLGVYAGCGDEWKKVGENIGRDDTVGLADDVSSNRIFDRYLISPLHYANIVDPAFNRIGLGSARGADGKLYVAQAFANCGYCSAPAWNVGSLTTKKPPVPGSNFHAVASIVGATGSQGYKVNGRGEMWTLDGKYVLPSEGSWNWDAIRSVGTNTKWQGYKLDAFGGLHEFGGATKGNSTGYWLGWDIARDVKLYGSGLRGYVLTGLGTLFSVNGAPTPHITGSWSTDVAKRFAINSSGTFGYVLDHSGKAWPFYTGSDKSLMPPEIKNGPYWYGQDIARDIVLSPNGRQGYILDGYGGVHPFSQPGYCKPPKVNPNFYTAGADLSVSLVIRTWGTTSSNCATLTASHGLTMDKGGGVHKF